MMNDEIQYTDKFDILTYFVRNLQCRCIDETSGHFH